TDRGLGFTLGVVHHALHRWLDTQNLSEPPQNVAGWLPNQRWLYARRGGGRTCKTALTHARETHAKYGEQADNNSKGCGGVMRSAPFGLIPLDLFGTPVADSGEPASTLFRMAAEAAGYTHGHPTGKLASGALAAIVS